MKRSHLPVNKFLSQGLITAIVGIVGASVLATMPVPALSAASTATATASARAQYARDVAHCRSLRPQTTERANCLSEASTRFSMTQPSKPQESPEILARNAVRRCDALPGADKTDCIARMQHGTASGSIAGGGVLRTLVTREPVVDPAALPPTAAGSAPVTAPAVNPAPATVPVPPMPPQPAPIVPPPPAPVVPAPPPESPQPIPPTPVPPMQPAG